MKKSLLFLLTGTLSLSLTTSPMLLCVRTFKNGPRLQTHLSTAQQVRFNQETTNPFLLYQRLNALEQRIAQLEKKDKQKKSSQQREDLSSFIVEHNMHYRNPMHD